MPVDMFSRSVMETKLEKMKTMVCKQRFFWGQIGEAACKHRAMGEGTMFWERKMTQLIFSECGATIAASSIQHHVEQSHGVILL